MNPTTGGPATASATAAATTEQVADGGRTTDGGKTPPSVGGSGAIMAAGSVVSRATGFVRASVVAAALGIGMAADGYAGANAVPMIVYMLLVGGALNAVWWWGGW